MAEAIRCWAIIPARAGSKGIAGKNLKKIQGRTLVARAVEAAKTAVCVERVFVTTDGADIAAAAKAAGAEIVERPAEIAGDAASSEAALLHALDALEAKGEKLPDVLVFVQCTSPFVAARDIDGTVKALLDAGADTAHTAAPTHGFLWRRDGAGQAVAVNHDAHVRLPRQQRDAEFLETGAVYAMRVAGFRAARHRFFGRSVLHETDPLRALEIDTTDDLALARLIAPLIEPQLRAAVIPDPLGGIVFDFDGVMTDDKVIVDEDGKEAVRCSRSDGFGIDMLNERSVPMAVISREANQVVARRCEKLGIACRQATNDKRTALGELCASWGVPLGQVIFVGNDLPDIPAMTAAGLGVAVGDAHAEVKAAADLVLTGKGGTGAVRELCDLVRAALDGRRAVRAGK